MEDINKDFRTGDTIQVSLDMRSDSKSQNVRFKVFTGICLNQRRWGSKSAFFVVRKLSKNGVGINMGLLLNSPIVKGIKIIKQKKFTRANIQYLKDIKGSKVFKY